MEVPGGEGVSLELSPLPCELHSVHLGRVALEAFLVQILSGRETDKFPHYFNGPHDIRACILKVKNKEVGYRGEKVRIYLLPEPDFPASKGPEFGCVKRRLWEP